jgi:hypothetical protein
MLQNWNKGLEILSGEIIHPDENKPLVLYDEIFTDVKNQRFRPLIFLQDFPHG